MPGYDEKVMQLRLCEEYWEALEEISSIKRGVSRELHNGVEQIPNFRAYFRSAMHKLAKEAPCNGLLMLDGSIRKTHNNFPIPDEDMPQLRMLAARFDITVPRLCSLLIVHPLLREFYDTKGF